MSSLEQKAYDAFVKKCAERGDYTVTQRFEDIKLVYQEAWHEAVLAVVNELQQYQYYKIKTEQ